MIVQHVSKTEGRWTVKIEGSTRVASTHTSRDEAIRNAVRRAEKRGGGTIKLHNTTGQFAGARVVESVRSSR
jgi:flavin-binding protein dodecin